MDRETLAQLRHELRTPLNHIIGYTEMLIEDGGRAELAPRLRAVLDDAQALLGLINELLGPAAAGSLESAQHLAAQLTSPLERILAASQAIKDELVASGAEEAAKDAGRINGAAEHLALLVKGGLAQRVTERAASKATPELPTVAGHAAASGAGVVLVVDDNPENREMLARRLGREGFAVLRAAGGAEALATLETAAVDLVLLDVMMPDINGYDVLKRLKADERLRDIPVLMISSLDEDESVARCIELGADDFLPKPFSPVILRARVSACLERKRLRDQDVRHAAELEEWNRTLEQRVQEGVSHLERLGRLKRFFSPQLAELIVGGGAEDPLRTHRRQVTVVFLDLRGFTSFAETAEPEEIMSVLGEYHAAMGELILAHEGTLERFTGDGMMIFFNDPMEVPDHAERAVRMALAMRECVARLAAGWKKQGWDLALGVGIAQGYATIGAIGFEGRRDYAAIGTVTNLAARLCGEAKGGQILVSSRLAGAVEHLVDTEEVGSLTLKGLLKPVPALNVVALKA
ncbi:MAG: response regulator [Betaproteobacteria bacterium]|jgi:class 3 adenylate cyclase|nr:response regulator [Betaproteobacteria bacterium]